MSEQSSEHVIETPIPTEHREASPEQNYEQYSIELREAQENLSLYITDALQRVPGLDEVDLTKSTNPEIWSALHVNDDEHPSEQMRHLQSDGSLYPLESPTVRPETLLAFQCLLSCRSNLGWAQKGLAAVDPSTPGLEPLFAYGRAHILGVSIREAKQMFEESLEKN